MEFRAWVEGLITRRYNGVATRLADAVGMSVSAFQRSTRNGTLSIENLLRLADETGESPAAVLRMAGKAEINDLIERLYGTAREKKDPDGQKAYELMTGIADPNARESFLQLMRGYQDQVQQARQRQAAPAPATHKAKQNSR